MDFLQQAFIYLSAAVIAVPIANRLGFGSVLGYITAGVMIGPVMGFVGGESESVKNFAEFGVVMMLFLVGLELKPSMLWSMRRQLLGLGGLQVLFTTLLLTAGGLFLGLVWQEALTLAMILALSSTAIVLQSLEEKGLMKTSGGKASMAVLLCQDIAVIPIFAILPLLALGVASGDHSGGHGSHSLLEDLPGYLKALTIAGTISAIIFGGHFLLRPALRFIATARLREIFTAAALLLVVAIALTMHLIGLSPALGTFLAGVVLSSSEYRHELESDISPFKGLLLGLFFISVGASIDFGLFFQNPGLVFGLALGIMVLKFMVLALLGRIFKMSGGDFWLFALGLSQAGEFSFVLLGFAENNGILSEIGIPGLAVAVSMVLTPLLFLLHQKVIVPRLSRKIQQHDEIHEKGPIIVAGIGRFGQVVNRLLTTNGYKTVVLDHDPNLIETVRKFGVETYYGDATRPDLLHAAGIQEAHLLIAALDDRERQTQLVHYVATNYPQCHIVARAYDRHHVYDLQNAGAHEIVREMFEASLDAGRRALIAMGLHPYHAERKSIAFRRHDGKVLQLAKEAWDQAGMDHNYINQNRLASAELENLMTDENQDRHDPSSRGWTPPPRGDALG